MSETLRRTRKRKRRRRILLASILLLVAIGFVIFLSSSRNTGVLVTVDKVQRRTIVQSVSATGTIEPETEVTISSETSGEIIYLAAEEGDTVRRGQLLVRIKPDIVQTQVEQLRASAEAAKASIEVSKAEMENAKNRLDRTLELYKKEFASAEELDQAQAAYRQAQARYQSALKQYEQAMAALKQAQLSLERTEIHAPIDGIVISLPVEIGEKVVGTAQMQGTEIMRIADLRVINAVVEVDENDVVLVKPGDSALVELDAIPNRKFKGVVLHVANAPLTQDQIASTQEVVLFKVEIRLLETDPRMRPGMTCVAEIQTQKKENVLAVPLQAVTVRRQIPQREGMSNSPLNSPGGNASTGRRQMMRPNTVVFVNNNGTAKMVPVETGISDGDYIEIVRGLEEGTEIVTGSFTAINRLLEDGSKLIIQRQERPQRFSNRRSTNEQS